MPCFLLFLFFNKKEVISIFFFLDKKETIPMVIGIKAAGKCLANLQVILPRKQGSGMTAHIHLLLYAAIALSGPNVS